MGAGMGLDVGVVGAEQRLGATDRERLGDVDELTTAVIAPAGIALGIFVRQDRPRGLEHGLTHEILRRDQLEALVLAVQLVPHDFRDFRIRFREPAGARGRVGFQCHDLSISAI
jgi:hypothetical protein